MKNIKGIKHYILKHNIIIKTSNLAKSHLFAASSFLDVNNQWIENIISHEMVSMEYVYQLLVEYMPFLKQLNLLSNDCIS